MQFIWKSGKMSSRAQCIQNLSLATTAKIYHFSIKSIYDWPETFAKIHLPNSELAFYLPWAVEQWDLLSPGHRDLTTWWHTMISTVAPAMATRWINLEFGWEEKSIFHLTKLGWKNCKWSSPWYQFHCIHCINDLIYTKEIELHCYHTGVISLLN